MQVSKASQHSLEEAQAQVLQLQKQLQDCEHGGVANGAGTVGMSKKLFMPDQPFHDRQRPASSSFVPQSEISDLFGNDLPKLYPLADGEVSRDINKIH